MNVEDFTPPQNTKAELYLLGAIMHGGNEAMDEAVRFVSERSFFLPAHGFIYEAMHRRFSRGERGFGLFVLQEELQSMGRLRDVGGQEYLQRITEDEGYNPANADYYAKSVQGYHQLREVHHLAKDLLRETNIAYRDENVARTASTLVEEAQEKLSAVLGDTENLQDMFIDALLPHAFERIAAASESGGFVGVASGLPALDRIKGGFAPTELIVVAARPGCGKTAIACNFAHSIAKSSFEQWHRKKAAGAKDLPARPDNGILFFSLEQGSVELVERILCMAAKVDGQKIRRGEIDEMEFFELSEAGKALNPLSLLIDGKPHQTVSSIASTAKRAKRKYGIGVVVIDYLGLIASEGRNQLGPEQQIAAITRRLKVLAKELSIPVILLAQLNRGTVNREDKRPRLADLRGSGAIEQDADAVLFVHRPEEFDPNDRPGEADLIVAKNRNGPKGMVPLAWTPRYMRFAEKATDGMSPDYTF